MAAKTSQLQIRVTEEQKTALKRAARAANMSVSQYVLRQTLPSYGVELSRLLERVADGDRRHALDELAALIDEIPAADFVDSLSAVPLQRLTPLAQNQVAAVVEQAAQARSVEPPRWVDAIRPLARPHFGWSLESLRPHQIRVTPVPFKRRGIFFEPATRTRLKAARWDDPKSLAREPESLQRLAILGRRLSLLELKVEFYLLGGAILFQTFRSRPPSARLSAQFASAAEVTEAVAGLTQREGWEPQWLPAAIKEYLVGGIRADRYLALPSLAVFVPPLEYVLALKIASLGSGAEDRTLDDVRYVVRALNLSHADAALEIAGRYFAARQLPPGARATLQGLLTA